MAHTSVLPATEAPRLETSSVTRCTSSGCPAGSTYTLKPLMRAGAEALAAMSPPRMHSYIRRIVAKSAAAAAATSP